MDSCDKEKGKKEKLYSIIKRVSNDPTNFPAFNNITVTKVADDCAEGELTVTGSSLNAHGIVHGGCLATLADTVAGAAVASRRGPCVTLNYGMDFLAPAAGAIIRCVATPRKVGKTICVYNCLLTDEKGESVATGNFTFFVMKK